MFYISLITSVVTTAIYFLFIYFDTSIVNLKILYYILGIQALFQFLNIEWMNEAYENYSFILYKTLVIRIGMLVAIFAFVKTPDDIVPYAIVMSATTIINYLLQFLMDQTTRFLLSKLKSSNSSSIQASLNHAPSS